MGINEVLLLRLLLTGDCTAWTAAAARVGLRVLSPNRKALSMPDATVAADLRKTANVDRNLSLEVAFYAEVPLDGVTKSRDFGSCQITDTSVRADACL